MDKSAEHYAQEVAAMSEEVELIRELARALEEESRTDLGREAAQRLRALLSERR